MSHPDDDYSRIKTALEALDGVAAVNLTEDEFSNFKDATRKLYDVQESIAQKPGCTLGDEDGDQA
jgi:hypothetical protein